MRYRDIPPPEGINVTQVHPLKELALLLSGAVAAVVALAFLLATFGGTLARMIPVKMEMSLVSGYEAPEHTQKELTRFVRELGKRLADQMEMPEELEVQIHVVDDDTVNAFATLGGQIILYQGLLERIPHENALAFLIAHELAHLKYRDPIAAFGQGAAVNIGLGLLLGSSNLSVLESAGLLTTLRFSREMETRADDAAIEAVIRIYGHATGAAELFRVLLKEREGSYSPPALFSTHPGLDERIHRLNILHRDEHRITPLPLEFYDWIESTNHLR
ncbi:MAG: M48 family metallopeptidase [Candidatus Sedimenticola endophacoides]